MVDGSIAPAAGPLVVGLGVAAAACALAGATAWAAGGDRRSAVIDRIVGGEERSLLAPPWFDAGVERLGLAVDTASLWPLARAAGVVVALLGVLADPRLLVVAASGAVMLAVRVRSRARRAPVVDAVAVVEALLAPLASGASLAQAVTDVGAHGGSPAGVALAPVARSIDEGSGAQEALDRWSGDLGDQRLSLVVDALAVAGASGGSRAVALAGVGRTIREREALAREVRALGSQARTSAVVLAATPVAFTSVVALVDGRVATFLCTTPAGLLCLLVGGAADAVGWWWMRRIVEGVS